MVCTDRPGNTTASNSPVATAGSDDPAGGDPHGPSRSTPGRPESGSTLRSLRFAFTDLVAIVAGGFRVLKVRSTPRDPAAAVRAGLATLGGTPRLHYGSTVATNALLERRGARVVLLTTAGFEDVIEIGRQTRPNLYALEPSGTGTRLTMSMDAKPTKLSARVLIPVVQPRLERKLTEDLERMRALLDGGGS